VLLFKGAYLDAMRSKGCAPGERHHNVGQYVWPAVYAVAMKEKVWYNLAFSKKRCSSGERYANVEQAWPAACAEIM
jgi:hypothetical protein